MTSTITKFFTLTLLLVLFTAFGATAWGQVSITTSNYFEDFDGLGPTGTAHLAGWTAVRYAGSGTIGATLNPVVDTGNGNSGNVYNYGKSGQTDRALGTLGSGSTIPVMGAQFTNNTGGTITAISLAGVMEQWRSGSTATGAERDTFAYSFDATNLTSGTWTNLSAMDLVEKLTSTTSATPQDGNNSANKTSISGSISSISWANGTSMWIRWKDQDAGGSDGGYAIDSLAMTFTIAAVPTMYRSIASGDWNSTSTWEVSTNGGGSWAAAAATPTDADGAITVRNGHTVTVTASVSADQLTVESTGTLSVNSSQTLTIADGTGTDATVNGVLVVAGTIAGSGSIFVAGDVRIDQGGWGGNTNTYSYDAQGRLVFNNSSGSYGVNSDFNAWPSSGGPSSVIVQNGGGMTLNTARTVSHIQVGNGTNTGVTTNGNLTVGGGGVCEITSGGFFSGGPIYGALSTLQINTGGSYGRGDEWSATSGAGYPYHVQITGSTYDLSNGAPGTARSIAGDLIIDNGATFTMDDMTANLSIGSLNNSGTLTLSTNIGGDMIVSGDWIGGSTFNMNERQVEFNGTGSQTINVSGGATFDYLRINKSSGTTVLATDVTVDNTLTLTSGNIDAGSNTLTVASGGSVSRTSGHVIGNLRKEIPANSTFEVGTANGYTPMVISNVSGPGLPQMMTVKATQTAHPNAFTANGLNRYWTVTSATVSSSDLEFNYLESDVVGTEANYAIRKYDGSWTSPGGSVDAVNNKLTITGVSTFSDWTASECADISFSPASLDGGNQGLPYSDTVVASGGSAPYTYALNSGSLPPGLSLGASDGIISGTPSSSGTFNFTVSATDNAGCVDSNAYSITVTGCPVITLAPLTLPNGGGIGAAYSQDIVASGGVAPYTWAVTSGALPGGVSLTVLNDSTARISGTFTADGVFPFTLEATDANTCEGDNAYTIVVCQNMPMSTPGGGTIGVAYNDSVRVTSGGTAPYSYAVTSGSLPAGLSMDAAGNITGTPTATGLANFDVTVTDANGCEFIEAKSINVVCPTITVNPATLPNGKVSVAYSQTITATGGTSPYTFAVTSGSLPTGLSLSSGGLLNGTPTANGVYNFDVTATDANNCTGVRSYTITIENVATFYIANVPGDTLFWRNAIWTVTGGTDADGIPDDDDVVLDNTNKSGSYYVMVGTVGPDSCRNITIGYAGNTNTIRLQIPKSSTVTNALKFGTNSPGNYDMVIDEGGIMDNSSGRTSGTSLNIRGFAAAGDSVWIKPGGKYLHRAKVSASGMLIGMSKDITTPAGTVEFDLYGNSTTARFPTMAGTVFGTLIFSATDSAIVYNPSTSQASAFGSNFIKGNLIVNPGASFITGTAGGYEEDFFIRGNLINNGGTFTFGAANTPVLIGPNAQSVTGTITFGKGIFIANSAGVSLSNDVTVSGGAVTTTGSINYRQPQIPTNFFAINAAGVLNTGSSTLYLNPSGSLNEGTNPIQGNISATRTAGTTLETFGNIGFEMTPGVAPGVTTILRKTGVASTGNGNQSILRYYDVTPTVNSGLGATIGVSYDDSELNGITEANLLLHKSTDGGATWSGKSGTINLALNKITATGVNSFSRWTAASSTAPLFITHTITIRKLADTDGDINTTGDQSLKKWRMTLYRDSVHASTEMASANPNSGILTVSSLEAGTYIAVEEDSLGWLHLGTIRNGTPILSSSRYDTVTVSGGTPATIDFINQQTSSISVVKYKDTDGDENTTGDQTAKTWNLSLYKDSVSVSTLVGQADTSSLVVSGLQAGTYIAVEADSGASWVRINGNGTRYDTVTVAANSNATVTFVNFRPNSLTVNKLEDADRTFGTDGDRTAKAWYMEIRSGAVNGPVVASGNVTTLSAANLGDGTYYALEADSSSWLHLGYVKDGTPTASTDNSVSFTLADGQNGILDFVNAFNGDYEVEYRSFAPESLGLDKDNKGKVNKFVARKADKVQVKLGIVAPKAATGFTIKFSQVFTGYIYNDTLKTILIDSIVAAKEKIVTTAVDSLEYFQIDGFGNKGKQITAQVLWATSPKVTKVDYKLPSLYMLNQPKLPMPNRVNVLAETFTSGGFGSTGLVVGEVRIDTPKSYGWLQAPKYTDVLKTVAVGKTAQVHNGNPSGFDKLLSGKLVLKQNKSLPPSKYNNELMSEMAALKLNIAASALGITPVGFGELVFDHDTLPQSYLQGQMVKDIATFADSVMMGFLEDSLTPKGKTVKVRRFHAQEVYQNLFDAVSLINLAFEGAMDTTSFADSLRVKGTRQLAAVDYLEANPNAIPARIIPTQIGEPQVPQAFALNQNYPNPFNPTTTISFDLVEEAMVTLKIYNMLGQEVATLFDRELMEDGFQEVSFDASSFATGVYFYRLVAEGLGDPEEGIQGASFTQVKKMLLVK